MSWASRRLAGWCTLVLFVASVMAPLVSASHQKWDADLACDPVVLAAGPLTAHLDVPAGPATAPEHCAVCHWLRAMSSANAGEPIAAVAAPDTQLVPISVAAVWHVRTVEHGRDTRGPPHASL